MNCPQSSADTSSAAKEFECEICLLPFDTKKHCPRILKECGHTLCEECAEELWKRGNMRQVKCPFDRIVTTVKGTIKNLQKNFTLERLLEAMKAEVVTAPQNQIGRCSKDPSHEAWFTCADCEADFCDCCFAKTHYTCEKSGKVNPERIPSIDKVYEAEKCQRHPGNFADFVCQDWDCEIDCKVICTVCLLEDHKDHEYGRIKEIVAENQKKLKEELIKKPLMIETRPYLRPIIPWTKESYEKGHREYNQQLKLIKDHYDRGKAEAIDKFEKYAEKKLEMANRMYIDYENSRKTEKALESIRSEMRHRLRSKRKLEDVEELVKKHKIAHDELNRDRCFEDIPFLSPLRDVRYKMPSSLEIIDPDEPSTSSSSSFTTSDDSINASLL